MRELFEERMRVCFEDMVTLRNINSYIEKISAYEGKKAVRDFLNSYGYQRIAIYGSGLAGRILHDNLKEESKIEVVGWIDKNHNSDYGADTFLEIEDIEKQQIDVIIVTSLTNGEVIMSSLKRRNIYNAVTLSYILDYEKVKSIYENGILI